jgi:SNF2 family DNA or RNA helicase
MLPVDVSNLSGPSIYGNQPFTQASTSMPQREPVEFLFKNFLVHIKEISPSHAYEEFCNNIQHIDLHNLTRLGWTSFVSLFLETPSKSFSESEIYRNLLAPLASLNYDIVYNGNWRRIECKSSLPEHQILMFIRMLSRYDCDKIKTYFSLLMELKGGKQYLLEKINFEMISMSGESGNVSCSHDLITLIIVFEKYSLLSLFTDEEILESLERSFEFRLGITFNGTLKGIWATPLLESPQKFENFWSILTTIQKQRLGTVIVKELNRYLQSQVENTWKDPIRSTQSNSFLHCIDRASEETNTNYFECKVLRNNLLLPILEVFSLVFDDLPLHEVEAELKAFGMMLKNMKWGKKVLYTFGKDGIQTPCPDKIKMMTRYILSLSAVSTAIPANWDDSFFKIIKKLTSEVIVTHIISVRGCRLSWHSIQKTTGKKYMNTLREFCDHSHLIVSQSDIFASIRKKSVLFDDSLAVFTYGYNYDIQVTECRTIRCIPWYNSEYSSLVPFVLHHLLTEKKFTSIAHLFSILPLPLALTTPLYQCQDPHSALNYLADKLLNAPIYDYPANGPSVEQTLEKFVVRLRPELQELIRHFRDSMQEGSIDEILDELTVPEPILDPTEKLISSTSKHLDPLPNILEDIENFFREETGKIDMQMLIPESEASLQNPLFSILEEGVENDDLLASIAAELLDPMEIDPYGNPDLSKDEGPDKSLPSSSTQTAPPDNSLSIHPSVLEPNSLLQCAAEKNVPLHEIWERLPQDIKAKVETFLHSAAKLLKANWLDNEKIGPILSRSLLEESGAWAFNIDSLPHREILMPLANLLLKQKGEDSIYAAAVGIGEILRFFRFYQKGPKTNSISTYVGTSQKNKELALDCVKSMICLHSPGTLFAEAPLCRPVMVQLAQTFFQAKMTEFLCRIRHLDAFLKQPAKQPRVRPCILITQNRDRVHAEMMASFFNAQSQLEGFLEDKQYVVRKWLSMYLSKASMDAYVHSESRQSIDISCDDLAELKVATRNDQSLIILERLPLAEIEDAELTLESSDSDCEASPCLETNLSAQPAAASDANKKRKREETELVEPTSKKARETCSKEKSKQTKRKEFSLKNPYNDLNEFPEFVIPGNTPEHNEGILPIIPSIEKLQLTENPAPAFNPTDFWKQLSLNMLQNVEQYVMREHAKALAIGDTKPLRYPILNNLQKIPALDEETITSFPFFNLLLKSYQKIEVCSQLQVHKFGLSRILAAEMGLGKTYIFGEVMLQLFADSPEGRILLVVPKSALLSILGDLRTIFQEGIYTAWKADILTSTAIPNLARKFLLLFSKRLQSSITADTQELWEHNLQLFLMIAGVFPDWTYFDKEQAFLDNLSPEAFSEGIQRCIQEKIERYAQQPENAMKLVELIQKTIKELSKQCLKDHELVNWVAALQAADTLEKFKNRAAALFGINRKSFSLPRLTYAKIWLAGKVAAFNPHRSECNAQQYAPARNGNLQDFPLENLIPCLVGNKLVQQCNELPSKAIFLTTLDAIETAGLQSIQEKQFIGICIDEIQKAHTRNTFAFKAVNALITENRKRNPAIPVILATGTPFENTFTELWNLLCLASGLESFLDETHTKLKTLYDELKKIIVDSTIEEYNQKSDKLESFFFKSFAQFYALKTYLIGPLVSRIMTNDPRVIQDWGGNIPTRRDYPIEMDLDDSTLKLIKESYQTGRENAFEHRFKRLLLHPSFIDTRLGEHSQEVNDYLNRLDDAKQRSLEEKRTVINESSLLRSVYRCERVQKIFRKNKRAIFITEHLLTARLLEKSMHLLFEEHKLESAIFHGTLKPEKKSAVISWFKKKETVAKPKVLMLMQKAGGVGLNLQEAEVVVKTNLPMNPGADDQAIARALRVNSQGVRKILSPYHENLLGHKRHEVIQRKKRALRTFLFEQKHSLKKQLQQWATVFQEEAHHIHLNDTKDPVEAERRTDLAAKIFQRIMENATEAYLQQLIAKAVPRPDF